MTLTLSQGSLITAGILLITVVTIEYGGLFVLKVMGGKPAVSDFQKAFFRAGHAHAGVLVILGLVCQVLVDATDLTGFWAFVAHAGAPAAAIFMPMGFFFSAIGRGEVTRPNRLIALLFLGAFFLAAGTLTLGVGLLAAAF